MNIQRYLTNMDYGPAPESDQAVRAWLKDQLEKRPVLSHWIDGAWHSARQDTLSAKTTKTAKTTAVVNPAVGKALASIPVGSADDLNLAVRAAKSAQPGWFAAEGHARARFLYALARSVQRNARLFATLETLNNGKPIRESRDIDIPLVARHFYYHAGWAQIQELELPDWEPIGVVGQVIPWNFPLMMLAWKVAPALAAGNSVVLKPAEQTPLTAILFAELVAEAGLPKGVFNLVLGDGSTGQLLVDHPEIKKLAFTGSTGVGRAIRKRTAGSGKTLTLELGGKSPQIVFDDADLDSAVEGVVDGIWVNQGEVCCAGSRLLLQESVAERFLKKLRERMGKLRVGDPLDKSTDMGALVSQEQFNRIRAMLEEGQEEGITAWTPDGNSGGLVLPTEGYFLPPMLIEDAPLTSRLVTEEIFGPVVVTTRFRTPDEAVMLANHSRFGLAASIWSETLGLALDVAPRLKAGVVWVNGTNFFDASVGFGGYRESGFGREGGREGFLEYLKPSKSPAVVRRAVKVSPESPESSTGGKAPRPNQVSDTTIDRTAKLYIGGKQTRPDGGYVRSVLSASGEKLGDVAAGNRKDIRNAVTAAVKAEAWGRSTPHLRAQILYYLAENLEPRRAEFTKRLESLMGLGEPDAVREVNLSIEALFRAAAYADKYEGSVHQPPLRGVALAMKEPMGIIAILCPEEWSFLSFITLGATALAMGNRIVCVPSERGALLATDFYQVLDTSDVPAGVWNIVTGEGAILGPELARHAEVEAMWALVSHEVQTDVEALSACNLKRVFCDHDRCLNFANMTRGQQEWLLHQAVQIKNIWVPYGE